MRWYEKLKKEPWFQYSLAICIGIIFYFVIKNIGVLGDFLSILFMVIAPLIVGVVFAYMMNPLAQFFDRYLKKLIHKENVVWKVAVLLCVLVILLALSVLVSIIVPQLVSSISGFVANSDEYMESLIARLSDGVGGQSLADKLSDVNLGDLLEKVSGAIFSENVISTSKSVGSVFANILIGFILAIYYLLDKEHLLAVAKKVIRITLPTDIYKEFVLFCSNCNEILIKYISCSILEAAIVGAANAVFMAIFRMPYIGIVSVVVGVTNLAPTFGPIVGGVIGCGILLLAKPIDALYFLIFTLILQTLDGYVIKPKLFSGSLGVSSLLILVFIIVLGNLFGVLGILLAIPFAAILQYVVKQIIENKEHWINADKKNGN